MPKTEYLVPAPALTFKLVAVTLPWEVFVADELDELLVLELELELVDATFFK